MNNTKDTKNGNTMNEDQIREIMARVLDQMAGAAAANLRAYPILPDGDSCGDQNDSAGEQSSARSELKAVRRYYSALIRANFNEQDSFIYLPIPKGMDNRFFTGALLNQFLAKVNSVRKKKKLGRCNYLATALPIDFGDADYLLIAISAGLSPWDYRNCWPMKEMLVHPFFCSKKMISRFVDPATTPEKLALLQTPRQAFFHSYRLAKPRGVRKPW